MRRGMILASELQEPVRSWVIEACKIMGNQRQVIMTDQRMDADWRWL